MNKTTNHTAVAAVFAISAMAIFGFIDNFIRLAAADGGLWQFHFLRAIAALAVLAVVALLTGSRLRPLRWKNVLVRSLFSSVSMVIYFGCLSLMPIAQAAAGLFTAPLFVVAFSVLLFGERIGRYRFLAILVGFGGALLALDLADGGITALTFVPVASGAAYAMGNIATQRWCKGETTLTLLGGFFGAMIVWGAIGVAVLWMFPQPVAEGADGFITRGWVTPSGIYLTVILMQGMGSLLGVGLVIRAYQMAEATYVAVIENLLLVFATIWAVVLWGEVPGPWQLVGLGMIILAGVVIALRSDAPRQAGGRAEV